MAIELLVRTTDGPAGRMRGDIVSVRQLPFRGWGKDETLPNYLVIRIDNTDKEGFKKYEGRHVRLNPEDPDSPCKRSKYRLDLDTLSKDYAEKRPHLMLIKETVTTNIILRGF
jgi:hypothetical protein